LQQHQGPQPNSPEHATNDGVFEECQIEILKRLIIAENQHQQILLVNRNQNLLLKVFQVQNEWHLLAIESFPLWI
jgi:hypothetical protein